jgi:N-methylhydantoinase A
MQSNGGLLPADRAAARPVHLVVSGPAAGVVGGREIGRQTGFERVITMDMGGTSCDLGLVEGAPLLTPMKEVDGNPIRVPSFDLHVIGAGGGSIAWIDEGGALRVGPQSAGADPGPACYGRGGAEPTVTDANLVLGRLNPAFFLGGAMPVDVAAARAAIEARVAKPFGLSVEAAAAGILRVVDAVMADNVKVVSVRQGHDPRDFALVACGGAGPLHGGRLAELLGIPVVIVPRYSGVLSTLGLLGSDIKNDYVRTSLQRHGAWDVAAVGAALADLESQGRQWLDAEGVPPEAQRVERFADLRYANQGYELTVAVPDGPVTAALLERTVAAFHAEHERTYTYATPELPVELVNVRVSAQGPAWPFAPKPLDATGGTPPGPALRRVYFPGAGGWAECPVHEAGALAPETALTGPAIITQDLSTIVVEPGHRARVDRFGNVIIELPRPAA